MAVIKIDELMQKELPNLVDERRFRRREQPEPFERDEYGRVWDFPESPILGLEANLFYFLSVNGQKSAFRSISSRFLDSTCELRLLGRAVRM